MPNQWPQPSLFLPGKLWESPPLFIRGTPQPKGSTRSVLHRKTGRILTFSDNPKLKKWENLVRHFAWQRWKKPLTGPVVVQVEFVLKRPAKAKRELPEVKPDLDKLVRGLLDGLNKTAFTDDAQVVKCLAAKRYGPVPGAYLSVTAYEHRPLLEPPWQCRCCLRAPCKGQCGCVDCVDAWADEQSNRNE